MLLLSASQRPSLTNFDSWYLSWDNIFVWRRASDSDTENVFRREVLLHVNRENVRVERGRQVWRHQNICTLCHCSWAARDKNKNWSNNGLWLLPLVLLTMWQNMIMQNAFVLFTSAFNGLFSWHLLVSTSLFLSVHIATWNKTLKRARTWSVPKVCSWMWCLTYTFWFYV